MHAEIAGELADRRQLVAGADAPLGEGAPQFRDDLLLDRLGAVDVDPDHDDNCIIQ
jgi:hypothetical protein